VVNSEAHNSPKKWKCIECRGTVCNFGVGLAGYDDDPTGIKWCTQENGASPAAFSALLLIGRWP